MMCNKCQVFIEYKHAPCLFIHAIAYLDCLLWLLVKLKRARVLVYFTHTYYMGLFCAARSRDPWRMKHTPLVSENSADSSVSCCFKCLHCLRMYTPCPFPTRRARFQHAVCAASCLMKIGHVRVYTVYIRNNLVRVYKYNDKYIIIVVWTLDKTLRLYTAKDSNQHRG